MSQVWRGIVEKSHREEEEGQDQDLIQEIGIGQEGEDLQALIVEE